MTNLETAIATTMTDIEEGQERETLQIVLTLVTEFLTPPCQEKLIENIKGTLYVN